MKTFAARRWLAGLLTASAAAAVTIACISLYPSLRDAAYFSGWTLLGICVFLAAYNVRKKFPYPPFLSSVVWLQLHVWVGAISLLVFVLHVDVAWPRGPFEITLGALFLLVVGTGFLGMFLTRTLPPRMASRGEEMIFERIPVFRRQLLTQASDLVVQIVEETDATMLMDFYARRLDAFFAGPRNLFLHICQATGPRERLLDELHTLDRSFNERERAGADTLRGLIYTKDGLDYQVAMQGLLKGWLFVHVPLTYVMLVLLVVHVVITHTFVGES
ncbi:MAG: hypothetical protein HKO59_07905 [Phycisphaerales bacterium]|nr:hypothetical protein [Phycisphaerae bacterium]NNM25897.1 hypothetical protein [Phycisphaerales bacterium]